MLSRIPLLLPVLLLMALSTTPAIAEKQWKLYLFSPDFPPEQPVEFTTDAVQKTRFWRLLDRELQQVPALELTPDIEKADYRVELRCGGITDCGELAVDIKDIERNQLASFRIDRVRSWFGLGSVRLSYVARVLTSRLEQRLELFEEGGYGHTE